jgi:hypothetical protein
LFAFHDKDALLGYSLFKIAWIFQNQFHDFVSHNLS